MPDAQNSEPANTVTGAPPSATGTTASSAHPTATGEFVGGASLGPDEIGALGPYRLVKQLGKGGMGAVYLARDTRLDRQIALKVMLPEFAADPGARERFVREAKAVAKIGHDNVVTVHEADERDGVPYIAMQFLQGCPLDEYLKQKGPPPLEHCVRIGIEAALGLAAAHAQGLVHRDIKPANLWLEAPNDRVKVLDFGLAKPVDTDSELTKSGAVVGTPAYMSPEQARAAKVDHRTDVFSLGVVMYKLLTGRNPFAGESVTAVLLALSTEEPVPIPARNPNVPAALVAFVMRMLAKNPDARPQTALEVANGLRAALAPPPVPGAVRALPRPAQPHAAPDSAFANPTVDSVADAADRTEGEADPPREPVAPKRGKGVLLAGGALALLAAVGAAIALGTGGKQPNEVAKNDPPPAPPKTEPPKKEPPKKEKEPQPPAPKANDSSGAVWAAGSVPVEVFTLNGHTGAVGGAAFGPDGARIVTASWDATAKVWEVSAGKPSGPQAVPEALTLTGHKDFVLSAAFNAEGTRIVTSSSDGTAKVWDARTGAELFALRGHSGYVPTASFGPDGTRIVTGAGGTAQVWEVPAGKPDGAKGATVLLTLKGHAGNVHAAAFSPDGARIVTGSMDKTAKVWDARTGAELFALKGHTESVTSVAFGAGGTRVVTTSADQTAKVWQVDGPNAPTELCALKGHTSFLSGAAFSPDGTRIVTASADRTAKVWDARTGAELCEMKGQASFLRAAFSPDGARIVTASADKTARVWEPGRTDGGPKK